MVPAHFLRVIDSKRWVLCLSVVMDRVDKVDKVDRVAKDKVDKDKVDKS